MEKLIISPLIPFYFTGDVPDYYWFNHAQNACYYQKIEKLDVMRLQLLSLVDNPTAKIKNFETGAVLQIIPLSQTATYNQNKKLFESVISFENLDGLCYIEISWFDVDTKYLFSNPFDVQDKHENTLLFDYSNSINAFSVIFANKRVFAFRVEGTIQDYTPLSEDEVYKDQNNNTTLLYSNPAQNWTLYIGNAGGVPDWVADKVNRIMSCDIVKIDGFSFSKAEGAGWEMVREVEYPFSGMRMPITTSNDFSEELVEEELVEDGTGDITPEAESVILRKNKAFLNKKGSFSVENVFENRTMLDYIAIQRTGEAWTWVTVGTTPTGSEIGKFTISQGVTDCVFTIRHLFRESQTLYIREYYGTIDFNFVYEKLDKQGGGNADAGIPNPSGLPKNSIIIYAGTKAQLYEDFNTATGIGRAGVWEDWAICDGRNGTRDLIFKFVKGAGFYGDSIGKLAGSDSITLAVENLPSHSHPLEKSIGIHYRSFKGDNDGDKVLIQGGSVYLDKTQSTGAGIPFNNEPSNMSLIYVQKIR